MRRTIIHSIHLLAAFLLMVTMSGCVEPISPDQPVAPGARTLTLQIALPSATSLLTKAGTDPSTIVGPNDERKVTSLQIWAFKHGAAGTDKAVAYYLLDQSNRPSEQLINPIQVSMTLPDAVMDMVGLDNDGNPNPMLLDFYVLANSASIGFTGNINSDLSIVRDAVIKGDENSGFGAAKVQSVPAVGLPMSVSQESFDVSFLLFSLTSDQISYIKGEAALNRNLPAEKPTIFSDAQWNYLKTKLFSDGKWDYSKVCVVLDLTRAVSKIRFVFAKATSMTDTLTAINKIELVGASSDDYVLPKSTYLFTKKDENGDIIKIKPDGTTYEAFSWASVLPMDVSTKKDAFTGKTVDTPLRLRKDSTIESGGKKPSEMSLEEYTTFLTTEITAGHALEKILYLRESDKTGVINVKINYTIGTGNAAVTADAYIPLNTSFTRNTWWTVYTYFMSYELGFQVTVLPWNGVESSGQLEDPELNL